MSTPKRVSLRTITQRTRTVGAPHDPTLATTTTLNEIRNNRRRRIDLVQIWDYELLFNGRRVAYGEEKVAKKLLKLTGLTPRKLLAAYDRIHPYINDPVGSLSMYI